MNNGCDYRSEFKTNLKKHIRKNDHTNGTSGERACLPMQADVRDVGSILGREDPLEEGMWWWEQKKLNFTNTWRMDFYCFGLK